MQEAIKDGNGGYIVPMGGTTLNLHFTINISPEGVTATSRVLTEQTDDTSRVLTEQPDDASRVLTEQPDDASRVVTEADPAIGTESSRVHEF